jgi:hypothetical protein
MIALSQAGNAAQFLSQTAANSLQGAAPSLPSPLSAAVPTIAQALGQGGTNLNSLLQTPGLASLAMPPMGPSMQGIIRTLGSPSVTQAHQVFSQFDKNMSGIPSDAIEQLSHSMKAISDGLHNQGMVPNSLKNAVDAFDKSATSYNQFLDSTNPISKVQNGLQAAKDFDQFRVAADQVLQPLGLGGIVV